MLEKMSKEMMRFELEITFFSIGEVEAALPNSATYYYYLLIFLLFFSYSFGYDCVLRNNLHVLDSKTLIFITGNLIHFLDVESGFVNFRLSALGLGITCLAVR